MKLPRFVHGFVDRNGKARYYYRRVGKKRAALPGLPWSEEFMRAYNVADEGEATSAEIGASRTMPGSFSALIVAYYNSTEFRALAAETQRTRRNMLERFRASMTETGLRVGDCRVAHLSRSRVDKMVAERSATPFAARNFVKTVRALMQFAISQGHRPDNPAAGTKMPKAQTEGYATWDEGQIAMYEAAHPIGTRARLAFALLLFTGQRRGDVLRMGRQHMRAGALYVRQKKTGTALEIPLHPELQAILDVTPADNLTFLMTEFGQPFSPAGFGNLFRDWCREAGLPKGYSSHGLRKAACRRLAELGCSALQIMAISGHRSLGEAEKYVRAADQRRLARDAIDTLAAAFPKRRENKTHTSIGKPE